MSKGTTTKRPPGRPKADLGEVFTNMKQLANAKQIPMEHLKVAKVLNCPACSSANRWYWRQFEPWYRDNLSVIEAYLEENPADESNVISDSLERMRLAKAMMLEIELKKKEGEVVDRQLVFNTIKNIANSQSIILRNYSQQLPHKLLGKNLTEMQIILERAYQEICNLFQQPLKEYTDGK